MSDMKAKAPKSRPANRSNSSTSVLDYFYKSTKSVKPHKFDITITACIDSETPVIHAATSQAPESQQGLVLTAEE